MNYEFEDVRENLNHVAPPPPMGGMPKPPDMIKFYTDNHDHHDNFKAIQRLWKQREGSDDSEDYSDEHSIYGWYD